MPQWESVAAIAASVNSGNTKALDNVEKSLALIKEHEEFRAIIADIPVRSRERAKKIDEKVAAGQNAGKLAGVPFIAKDNFLVFGANTTAASNILKGFDAPYQATVIERLEAEGAICVAKANLDAFAHGSSTENSDFMTTLNPFDKERIPGGSSGGSAAAVALDLAPFSLGTDTGGSIRLPASFCGVVGFKPTYGVVSRSGVVAMASSTDVIGPIAKTVEDASLVMECMAGKDPLDGTTIELDDYHFADFPEIQPRSLTIGVIKEFFGDGLDPGVNKNIQRVINNYKKLGFDVKEISVPSINLALAVYYVLCPAEVSSNLSRYDGQRFGYTSENSKDLDESFAKSRSEGFGDEAKRRIMIGTYVLSSGYYDAYYQKAQLVRTKLIKEFEKAFEQADVLVGPTAPVTAFKVGEHTSNPLEMYLIDIMTVAANLVGAPSISIPAGTHDKLPVGLQLIMKQRADKELLAFSKYTEENAV